MRIAGVHPIYFAARPYEPPADWNIRPISDYAILVKGKMPSALLKHSTPNSLPYLLIDGLEDGETMHTEEPNLPTIDTLDTAVVADGSRSGLAIRGLRGVLGSTLLAYRARPGFDPDYLFYLLESLYHYNNTATIGGAIPHLDKRLLAKLAIATPKEEEQRRIAGVLKLADEAIAKAQAELDATREVKRSLMATLFVEGIPGRHCQFVSSPLGRIPATWQIRKIREVLACPPTAGTSPQSRPEPPGTPILNVSCVGGGLCDPTLVTYVDVSDAEKELYRARRGDFFVLRGNGNRDYVATGGLLRVEPPEETIYSDKLIRLRFKESEVAESFIPFMWESPAFRSRLQSKAESGSGLWMISRRDIVKERFLFPPKDEQEEIVRILESIHDSLTALETKLRALREVKKSLLQNLLTGKIRLKEDIAL